MFAFSYNRLVWVWVIHGKHQRAITLAHSGEWLRINPVHKMNWIYQLHAPVWNHGPQGWQTVPYHKPLDCRIMVIVIPHPKCSASYSELSITVCPQALPMLVRLILIHFFFIYFLQKKSKKFTTWFKQDKRAVW